MVQGVNSATPTHSGGLTLEDESFLLLSRWDPSAAEPAWGHEAALPQVMGLSLPRKRIEFLTLCLSSSTACMFALSIHSSHASEGPHSPHKIVTNSYSS